MDFYEELGVAAALLKTKLSCFP